MSKTHKPGERIIPLDHERNPNVFTPADTLTMDHKPSPVAPLPKPDSVSMNGEASA